MVRTKICGITNLDDAKSSIGAGCDALGFVFYKKSPRYISPDAAAGIIRQLPKGVVKIGVFVNQTAAKIRRTAKLCGLDMIQLHGDEPPEFCEKLKGLKVIKAFRIKRCIDEKKIIQYNTFAYLFDTFSQVKAGGTGKTFNWKLIRHINSFRRPVFLSGGLTAKNVESAIKCVNPDWVDVSSSLEKSPGKKDSKKVSDFIQAVKNKD